MIEREKNTHKYIKEKKINDKALQDQQKQTKNRIKKRTKNKTQRQLNISPPTDPKCIWRNAQEAARGIWTYSSMNMVVSDNWSGIFSRLVSTIFLCFSPCLHRFLPRVVLEREKKYLFLRVSLPRGREKEKKMTMRLVHFLRLVRVTDFHFRHVKHKVELREEWINESDE